MRHQLSTAQAWKHQQCIAQTRETISCAYKNTVKHCLDDEKHYLKNNKILNRAPGGPGWPEAPGARGNPVMQGPGWPEAPGARGNPVMFTGF